MIEIIKNIKEEIKKSQKRYENVEKEFERKNGVFEHKSTEELFLLDNVSPDEWREFIQKIPVTDMLAGISDKELDIALSTSKKFPHVQKYRAEQKNYYNELESYLNNNNQANLSSIFGNFESSEEELKDELKNYNQSQFFIPKNLMSFLKFSSSTGGDFYFFGQEIDRFGIAENIIIRELIEDEIFPSFMIRFLILGDYCGGSIGTWLYDREVEDSEILFLDYEANTIQIVSKSMKNFTQRALKCYQEKVEQDYFEPSDEALQIIHSIDGEDVLPDAYEYSLTFTEDYPEHWQEIITDS